MQRQLHAPHTYDLERVAKSGVAQSTRRQLEQNSIWTGDVDLPALRTALGAFGIDMPSLYSIAVQDHGYLPGARWSSLRYQFHPA